MTTLSLYSIEKVTEIVRILKIENELLDAHLPLRLAGTVLINYHRPLVGVVVTTPTVRTIISTPLAVAFIEPAKKIFMTKYE